MSEAASLAGSAEEADHASSTERSPSLWRVALGQLIRNPVAVCSTLLILMIIGLCLWAPWYAAHIAHTDPFRSNVTGTTVVNGHRVDILQQSSKGLGLGVVPIGPTWHLSGFFLGADGQGRDVFARLLYGGRTSLFIGTTSAILCCALGAILGIVAGYLGGATDWILSRILDVIWAFPVYLLAICLSVVLLTSGLNVGPVHVSAGSLMLPIVIIALIYVPYVARPIRGQVLSLKEREFIKASVGLGAGDMRVLRREILPNVLPAIIVFLPLMMALNMLTESALSFLSIGVQAPQASWGTIINDGLDLLYTRPWVAAAPGIMLVITAVAFNLLGDAVRDALDPKAKLRGSI